MNVGEALVAQLERWGVETIFGVSGSSLLPFLDALRAHEGIHYLTVRHEEAAAFMASAHAKLTGHLGVCLAHAGPGAAHLVNGLYDAHKDRYPVLALTGQVPTEKIGTTYKQSSDEQLMFMGCAGFSRLVASADETIDILSAAMRYAIAHRDVAHVALPADLLAETFHGTGPRPPEPYLAPRPAVDPEALKEAVETLDTAHRLVILMGQGARNDAKAVLMLAEHLGAPLVTSLAAKGLVPETHPLVTGPVGEAGTEAALAAVQAADTVLVLGSTWWPQRFMPKHAQVIQIDLWPIAIGSGSPVSVGLVAKAADVVPELHKRLPSRTREGWPTKSTDGENDANRDFPAHPALTLNLLRKHLPNGAMVAVDTGLVTLWYGRSFSARNETTLISGRWRSMGFALPAALAAKWAQPESAVLALTGDGGFAMTAMEFLTAVQHDLPVTVIVLNNGLLGEEAAKQGKARLPIFGMDLNNADFAAFANACGGLGLRPQDADDLGRCLQYALESGRPALVDVPTRFVAPSTLMDSPPVVAYPR